MNELIIRIKEDSSVSVESVIDGVKSYKAIAPDSLLKCIKDSLRRGGVNSGLLPKNCVSITFNENGSKEVFILHPEDRADITFLKSEYKGFPLPRMVFGFTVSDEGRVSTCRLGVIERGDMLKPNMKMYKWPFSNVVNTRICIGNNPLPKCKSLHTLASLPYLILALPNNLDGFSSVRNRNGLEMRDLLELLKDKTQDYYYEHILEPSDATLGSFIA